MPEDNIKPIKKGLKVVSSNEVMKTPDEEVVTTLKELLGHAEKGDLTHLVFVGTGDEGSNKIYTGTVGVCSNMYLMSTQLHIEAADYLDLLRYGFDEDDE